MKKIDIAALDKVTGGVRQGSDGRGCTGPFCGPKRPRPTGFPGGQPPFQIPRETPE